MPIHHDFLERLAARLSDRAKRGLFTQQHLLNGQWNQNSWLHSRVWGAMIEAVPDGLSPMVDVKWDRGFKPDLCLVDHHDLTRAIIEYESTNSSDERVPLDKLVKFRTRALEYVGAKEPVPECWLLITTLPDGPVQRWPWHGWNDDKRCPPHRKDRRARDVSPLAYYERHWQAAFGQAWAQIAQGFGQLPPLTLVWANVGLDGVRVLNVDGQAVMQPHFAVNLP